MPAGVLNTSNRGAIINYAGRFPAGRRPSDKIKKGGNVMKNGNQFEADGGRYQERLLWPPNFEAKSKQASFKEKIHGCEASALTPEPTALYCA